MMNIKATTRTSTFLKKSYELSFTTLAMMLMAQVALAQSSVVLKMNNDDNSMSLQAGGSEKVIIQTDGRMGVNLNGNKPNISFLDVSGTLQLGQYDNPGTSSAGNIVFRTLRANTSEGYGSGNPTGDNRAWMVTARGHSDALYPGLFSLQYWGGTGTDWVNALNLDKSGKVGVITKQPVTALDVSGTLMISNGGEACNASTEGAIRYTAAGGVMYCDATSWTSMGGGGSSDNIAAGDTSVSIVDAGTGQIHLDVDGNRLITALDGALNVSGSLSVSSGISVPKENGVGFFGESPYAAAPLTDGARLYVNKDYFGTSLDAFVIEKTDFNNDMSDGGVVFTVRDQNNTVYENMVIRGAGGVSITVHDTSSALIVTAPNLTKSSALTLRELPLSTGEGDGKAIGILASGESTARFMVYTDGKLGIGDGSNFRDVYLSRSGLNTFLVSEDGVSGTADLHVTGTVSATAFVGDGSGLTGVGGASALNDLSDGFYSSVNKSMALGVNAMSETAVNNPDNIDVYGNVAIGESALHQVTTDGNLNTAVGYNSGSSLDSGAGNVAIGGDALSGTTGYGSTGNVVVGNSAMSGNANGTYNVVVGADAGDGLNNAVSNILMGYSAATNLGTGLYNIILGDNAADNLTAGSNNIVIGATSVANATGSNQLNIGNFIKASNMGMTGSATFEISDVMVLDAGSDSFGIGKGMNTGLFGDSALYIGNGAGTSTGGGENSVLLGNYAATNATYVGDDVLIGYSVAPSYDSGSGNIIIGANVDVSEANAHNELNIGNTLYGNLLTKAIGVGVVSPATALEVSGTVSATAFVGDGSGLTNVAGGLWTDNTNYINYEGVRFYKPGTTWDHSFGDTGVYYHADKSAYRIGRQNNGSGDEANVGQYSLGMGDAVIASGLRSFAMGNTSTASGADSFAFGSGAQATGARAIAMGNGARALNSDAIAIGSGTYASNLFSTALGRSTAATQNSAFAVGNGARASGVTSVALGMGTEAKNNYSLATNYQTIASGAQSVAMGRGSQANGITSFAFGEGVIAQGNYSYVIGLDNGISGTTVTDARTMAILGGEVGIGLTSPSVELDVSGSIQYTGNLLDASDRRLKQNIQPIEDGALERMGQVEAVSFEMKDRPGVTELGVIAQDFENIYPELVKTADDEMGTKSVNYIGMIAPMVKAMQELKAEVDELKAQNAEQARLIEELQAK